MDRALLSAAVMNFARPLLALVVLVGCAPVTEDSSGNAPPAQNPGHGSGGSGGAGGQPGANPGAGGSGGSGGGAGSGGMTPPKQPPTGTGGGPTASGCNGVTEKGRCEISDQSQTAVVCDVAANQIRRFDCTSMQKVCVLDAQRGATCMALPPPPPPMDMARPTPRPTDMAHVNPPPPPPHPMDMAHAPPPAPMDMAVPMCASGIDYLGYCAASTAIWCDPATGQTIVVNCANRGQVCAVDQCADGAYCCDAPAPIDMAQPPTSECDSLGFAGLCTIDNHARWCSDGQVVDIDCSADGEECQVDTCASGAYCCAPMSLPPDMSVGGPASSRVSRPRRTR